MSDLEKTLGEKNRRIEALTAELKELTARHQRLVEDSQDVVSIVEERDALKERNANLAAEKDELQKANTRLTRRAMVFWFLAGGGVFFVGWIVGQFSRSKRRRF